MFQAFQMLQSKTDKLDPTHHYWLRYQPFFEKYITVKLTEAK